MENNLSEKDYLINAFSGARDDANERLLSLKDTKEFFANKNNSYFDNVEFGIKRINFSKRDFFSNNLYDDIILLRNVGDELKSSYDVEMESPLDNIGDVEIISSEEFKDIKGTVHSFELFKVSENYRVNLNTETYYAIDGWYLDTSYKGKSVSGGGLYFLGELDKTEDVIKLRYNYIWLLANKEYRMDDVYNMNGKSSVICDGSFFINVSSRIKQDMKLVGDTLIGWNAELLKKTSYVVDSSIKNYDKCNMTLYHAFNGNNVIDDRTYLKYDGFYMFVENEYMGTETTYYLGNDLFLALRTFNEMKNL